MSNNCTTKNTQDKVYSDKLTSIVFNGYKLQDYFSPQDKWILEVITESTLINPDDSVTEAVYKKIEGIS